MSEVKLFIDAYGDCELVGDVYRDGLGDLSASNVRLEFRVEGRLMRLKPLCQKDLAHLSELLIGDYELSCATRARVDAI